MAQRDDATQQTGASGKGRPTPTRKEAQAKNQRPLVGDRSKEARAAARADAAAHRERVREGVARGDEQYLTIRDRGPQRRFIRDYVDARFTVGEFVLPLMFVLVILSFFPRPLPLYSVIALWTLILLVAFDSIVLGFTLKRALVKKFGAGNLQRGFRWYAASRALQMRFMRLPKARVKRGEFPK